MSVMREVPRYYVVRKGRGYWQPNQTMARRYNVRAVPCGVDGPSAHRTAEAGQDTAALLEVGLHKSPRMVERYTHLDVTEEARKADLLPTPKRGMK